MRDIDISLFAMMQCSCGIGRTFLKTLCFGVLGAYVAFFAFVILSLLFGGGRMETTGSQVMVSLTLICTAGGLATAFCYTWMEAVQPDI